MTEFLTSRKIGFMFGCFGFILAHLGRFWVGIAECGAHVGLWVSSWCFDGVSVMSGHCACGLSPVSWCWLWVVGVLCLGSAGRIGGKSVVIWWRLGGVSVTSWCNPRGVSVLIAQVRFGGPWAGMYVPQCLRVILLVLWWHLSRTFGGVCAVSCLWMYCWCWHGVFWL